MWPAGVLVGSCVTRFLHSRNTAVWTEQRASSVKLWCVVQCVLSPPLARACYAACTRCSAAPRRPPCGFDVFYLFRKVWSSLQRSYARALLSVPIRRIRMRPANCLLFEASPLEHFTAIKNYINIKLSLLLSIEKIKSYMSAGDLLGPDLFIFFMGPPSWGDVEGAPGAVALAALAAPRRPRRRRRPRRHPRHPCRRRRRRRRRAPHRGDAYSNANLI